MASGEPYIKGSLYYLNAAIGWAAKYDLKVMVRPLSPSSLGTHRWLRTDRLAWCAWGTEWIR